MSVAVRYDLPFHRRVLWRCGWLLVAFTVAVVMRARRFGVSNVPMKGGALLVANHTTAMDFMMPVWGAWRPIFAIGSEQVLKLPVGGWILRQFNAMPVSQGKKDRAAVMHLVEAYKHGQMVFMFPEGKRTWTGRTLPVTPGSGRLVKSLGCPVVHCRVTTGYLFHPRWAKWPRFVPYEMHYDPPVTYPPEASAEEITEDMRRRITVDPDAVPAPRGSWGFRMAEGLPSFLWACPACFATESLQVPAQDRDSIVCPACGQGWRIDVSTHLTPHRADGEAMTVATAFDRISAHFGSSLDPARYAQDGVALEVAKGSISRIQRGKPKPELLHEGRVQLLADRLRILGEQGETHFELPYSSLLTAMLEFRSMLVMRTEEVNYVLSPGGESPHKWHHFLTRLLQEAGVVVRD